VSEPRMDAAICAIARHFTALTAVVPLRYIRSEPRSGSESVPPRFCEPCADRSATKRLTPGA
jgi:hypothetical protein